MFAELEQKALSKALEFFGALASGDKPHMPEAWGAEILAHTLANVAGVPMPDPLPDVGPRPQEVGGMIRELPEAETLLRAYGWARAPKPIIKLVFSAFASNPGSQWSAKQLMGRLPVPATSVQTNNALYKLEKIGVLTRVGLGVYTLKAN